MILKTVDLYAYFHLPKPENGRGELVCCVPLVTPGVNENRIYPGVLILPGGGYAVTVDRESEPIAFRFLSRGYSTFTLHYSCYPVRFPHALREAAMAMRYIRENARDLRTDPGKIAAIGFSAGGHLCGCIGTMYDCPEVRDLGEASLLRPDALGLCYPVLVSWGRTNEGSFDNLVGQDPQLRQRLSLEKMVRPDMPPAFLWHTRDDACVPCRNSLLMAQAMEEADVDFAMHIYHRGPHGASNGDDTVYPSGQVPDFSDGVDRWVDEMIAFFKECGLKIED